MSLTLSCLSSDHFVVRKRGIKSTGVQRISLLKKDDRHRRKFCWGHSSRRRLGHECYKVKFKSVALKLHYKVFVWFQDVDENGLPRFEQLSMATSCQRHCKVFIADIRETCVCWNLSLAQLYTTARNASCLHGHGLDYDVIRTNWETGKAKILLNLLNLEYWNIFVFSMVVS